jgi:hypothetical protein
LFLNNSKKKIIGTCRNLKKFKTEVLRLEERESYSKGEIERLNKEIDECMFIFVHPPILISLIPFLALDNLVFVEY